MLGEGDFANWEVPLNEMVPASNGCLLMLAPGSAEEDELLKAIECLDDHEELLGLMMEKVEKYVERMKSKGLHTSVHKALRDGERGGHTLLWAYLEVKRDKEDNCNDEEGEYDEQNYSPNWATGDIYTYDSNRGFGYIHTDPNEEVGEEMVFFHISDVDAEVKEKIENEGAMYMYM